MPDDMELELLTAADVGTVQPCGCEVNRANIPCEYHAEQYSVALDKLFEEKACSGNPDWKAHPYIGPYDTEAGRCEVCGDLIPFGPDDAVPGAEED